MPSKVRPVARRVVRGVPMLSKSLRRFRRSLAGAPKPARQAPVPAPLVQEPDVCGAGPLLSVIVPAYNVEKYLADCLGNLTRQTYEHLEIIVVHDGSTDGSYGIARSIADTNARIQLVRQPNGGLGSARNTESGMPQVTSLPSSIRTTRRRPPDTAGDAEFGCGIRGLHGTDINDAADAASAGDPPRGHPVMARATDQGRDGTEPCHYPAAGLVPDRSVPTEPNRRTPGRSRPGGPSAGRILAAGL